MVRSDTIVLPEPNIDSDQGLFGGVEPFGQQVIEDNSSDMVFGMRGDGFVHLPVAVPPPESLIVKHPDFGWGAFNAFD